MPPPKTRAGEAPRALQAAMKDDIDSLLNQYLPLDGATSSMSSSSRSNARMEGHPELRLIGGLENGSSADEPSDL